MTSHYKQIPLNGIKLIEEEVEMDKKLKIIYKNIKFDSYTIKNFTSTSLFNNFLKKIKDGSFCLNDFQQLNEVFNDFLIKIYRLMRKIKPKIENQENVIFKRILDSIQYNFGPIGRKLYEQHIEFFNKTNLIYTAYLTYAETIYEKYLKCLYEIEKITGFKVYKGLPQHMLGMINLHSGRYMDVLPRLGMALIENRAYKIESVADDFLNFLYFYEMNLFQDIYIEVIKDFSKYPKIIQNLPDNVSKVIIKLESQIINFPENALRYLTLKFMFINRYLNEYYSYKDIFSSFLRLDFLQFFTIFIETLLKRVLNKKINSKDNISELIYEFNKNAFSFNFKCKILKYSSLKQIIPSFKLLLNEINKNKPDYINLCDFILNLTTKEFTIKKDLDISNREKLKIFQSSIILRETRNQFHHELNISSLAKQTSIREGIPKIYSYLREIKKYKKIFDILRYYTCLVFIYAYQKS